MNKVFVYGTLKKGFYNHNRCGLDKGAKFIAKGKLEGYVMFDLGYYPCILHTGIKEDVVFGEVYQYTDEKVEKNIIGMELDAGYKMTTVKVNDMDVKVFEKISRPHASCPIIENGIWDKQLPFVKELII